MASTKPFATTGNVGAAGELAFRSEVLLRGYDVWIPQVDSGVDVVVGSKTVQVKTALAKDDKRRFSFALGRARRKGWEAIAEGVDVLALVGVAVGEAPAYWLLPVSDLRRFTFAPTVKLRAEAPGAGGPPPGALVRWMNGYRGAWHLLETA